jgi:Protein kinase domain
VVDPDDCVESVAVDIWSMMAVVDPDDCVESLAPDIWSMMAVVDPDDCVESLAVAQEDTKDSRSMMAVVDPDDCVESLALETATTAALTTAVAATTPAVGTITVDDGYDDDDSSTTSIAATKTQEEIFFESYNVGTIAVDDGDDDDDSSTTSIAATKTQEEIFMESYELVKELGQGAFGTVFRARSLVPGLNSSATYAVKMIMPPDDRARQMIRREIDTLCYLWGDSDHIVQLLEVFELSPNSWALVMEECQGGSVADRMGIKGYYFESDALALFANLLRGLQYVHDLGIVHLDLKPANVLLVEQRDDTRVKLADFGLAQRVHTPNGLIRGGGTPGYMAPELSAGTGFDQCADMFSLGVMMAEVLGCGEVKLFNGQYQPIHWRNSVTSGTRKLILNLLQRNPDHRYSAEQALDVVESLMAGRAPVVAAPVVVAPMVVAPVVVAPMVAAPVVAAPVVMAPVKPTIAMGLYHPTNPWHYDKKA